MEDFSARAGDLRFHNDLEPVVTRRFPVVREHLEWLARRAPGARLTGSGGCVFAAFQDRGGAERVIDEMPASMAGFVAQGLEKHPLGP